MRQLYEAPRRNCGPKFLNALRFGPALHPGSRRGCGSKSLLGVYKSVAEISGTSNLRAECHGGRRPPHRRRAHASNFVHKSARGRAFPAAHSLVKFPQSAPERSFLAILGLNLHRSILEIFLDFIWGSKKLAHEPQNSLRKPQSGCNAVFL